MTTRRTFLSLSSGVLAASALTACREPKATAAPPPAIPDVLLTDTHRGLTRLTGTTAHLLGDAAASTRDGTIAYATADDRLTRLATATGSTLATTDLGGGWLPRVISDTGDVCVFAQTAAADPPRARASTALLVMGPDGRRKFNLSGVIEPDAFTTGNTGLFVLEWLPRDLPDRYRVRLLDLATGELRPLLTRTKVPVPAGAEEEMRGTGRQAVLSPGRQVLYTLYTHQPDHQHTRNLLAGSRSHVHAFVHVLHLAEHWAYCLDLPDPFGRGPAEGHALAADDRHIAVLDTTSGGLVYADAGTFEIRRVARIPAGGGAGGLALGGDDRVFAAAGSAVHVLDRGSDRALARWELPSPVRGLELSRDGARLYAGGTDEVSWSDTASGVRRGRVPVNGLHRLRHVV